MTPNPIELHPEAMSEARSIRLWYSSRDASASDAFMLEFDYALERIIESPSRWPRFLHGTRRYLLRRFPYSIVYGRGAPVRLSTGPNKNSSVTFLGGNRLFTTGSGHRIGRANYYQIQQSRYVDFERDEAVPLGLAVSQFLDDVPRCVNAIMQKPEVVQYLQARE